MVIAAAIAVFLLVLAAEWLHARRVRRVAYLSFGPAGRPAAWVKGVPLARALATAAAVHGAITLWRYEPTAPEPFRSPRASKQLMICLDVSPSMWIADAGPDRPKMTRAHWAGAVVQSILDRVNTEDTRITLVAFYTKAVPVLVDTCDKNVVSYTLNGLPLDAAFTAGETNAVSGVDKALEMAKAWARQSTTLVVVSDGDVNTPMTPAPRPPSIADTLVIGVGDTQRTSQVSNHASRQDAASLKLLAARLGGVYFDANRGLLPPRTLASLRMIKPREKEAWSEREHGLLELLTGAATLAGLGPMLAAFGAPAPPRRDARDGAGRRRWSGTRLDIDRLAGSHAMRNRILWVVWGLVLICGVGYHYGPGQRWRSTGQVAALIADADRDQQVAEAKQKRAGELSVARAAAKRRSMASGRPADAEDLKRALSEERAAWKDVHDTWATVAQKLDTALSLLRPDADEQRSRLRLRRDRALLASGKIFGAASDLENFLEELTLGGAGSGPLADQARADIGAAHYEGARALRLNGRPDAEWRLVSTLARQQFRHLAENRSTGAPEAATAALYQKNLEVVLNLEQCTLDDLEASPTPMPPMDQIDLDGWLRRPGSGNGPKLPGPGTESGGNEGDPEAVKGW